MAQVRELEQKKIKVMYNITHLPTVPLIKALKSMVCSCDPLQLLTGPVWSDRGIRMCHTISHNPPLTYLTNNFF